MGQILHIWTGGTAFSGQIKCYDDEILPIISKKLLATPKESTFDTLYKLARSWRQHDGLLPYPSNDRRSVLIESVWTFDLDQDVVRWDKNTENYHLSLNDLRQFPVIASDFSPYTPLKGHECTMLTYFKPPFRLQVRSELGPEATRRQKDFILRLLSDFTYQWRHALNYSYNETIFRRFACSIVRLTTLDFKIVECDSPRRGKGGPRIWLIDLPEWKPFRESVFAAGSIHVVVSRHMPHAIELIRDDFSLRWIRANRTFDDSTYLIISMKNIILYKMSTEREIYSRPQPLFDSSNIPTPEAIELLMTMCVNAPKTRIHHLPVEIQDMILDNVCVGPIERARVGCVLQIGTEFQWKRRDGQEIEREEGHRHRHIGTPVESEVWFGDCFSGLSYK